MQSSSFFYLCTYVSPACILHYLAEDNGNLLFYEIFISNSNRNRFCLIPFASNNLRLPKKKNAHRNIYLILLCKPLEMLECCVAHCFKVHSHMRGAVHEPSNRNVYVNTCLHTMASHSCRLYVITQRKLSECQMIFHIVSWIKPNFSITKRFSMEFRFQRKYLPHGTISTKHSKL